MDLTCAGDTNSTCHNDKDKGDKVNEKSRCTWIGEYSSATKRALKNANRCEHEAWAYLDERHLGRAVRLQRILFDYLPRYDKYSRLKRESKNWVNA